MLNGNSTNFNYSAVTPSSVENASPNTILGSSITSSQLTLNIGTYTYSTANQVFVVKFPAAGTSGTTWNAVQAVVSSNVAGNLGFSKIFNIPTLTLSASSTAAHRPRDICMILDYSGSMRFSSLLSLPYSGNRTTNNLDTVYPAWGHYAGDSSELLGTAPVFTLFGREYLVDDQRRQTADHSRLLSKLYRHAGLQLRVDGLRDESRRRCPAEKQFQHQRQLRKDGCRRAEHHGSITNSTSNTTFETKGYAGFHLTSGTSGKFNGYTMGPGYYGATFFYWPPDPTNDWRTKYFTFTTNSGNPSGKPDNSKLWNSSGIWQAPSSSGYQINYNNILTWIISTGVFPSQLQSGRIVYYSQIPTTINTSSWPPSDLNQRFWKDYIDYVLGVMQTSSGASGYTTICNGSTGLTGYGEDYTWGTPKITAFSSLTGPYMNYADNPQRPLLNFWFGPMTMIDFLGNYNLWYNVTPNCSRYCWWPGTCHEAPLYACKLGIQAALGDIQNNHPNDFVSLIMFSTPKTGSSDTSASRFNRVRVPLGQDYTNLTNSLWYPPATIGSTALSSTVSPYDTNNLEVPRAMGGTCYAMGLMLAYNQFSSQHVAANLQRRTVRHRRRGRQRPHRRPEDHHLRDRRRAKHHRVGKFQQRRRISVLLLRPLQQQQPQQQRVSQQRHRLQRQRFARSPRRSTAYARNWPRKAPPAASARQPIPC